MPDFQSLAAEEDEHEHTRLLLYHRNDYYVSGSTGATFVVCNGLQKAFNFNPRWLALLVAQIIVLVGVYAVGKRELLDYFVGVINGFLALSFVCGRNRRAGRRWARNRRGSGARCDDDDAAPNRSPIERAAVS